MGQAGVVRGEFPELLCTPDPDDSASPSKKQKGAGVFTGISDIVGENSVTLAAPDIIAIPPV
jgi:hypothetical protein